MEAIIEVENFSGLYKINHLGEITSLRRSKLLKQGLGKQGYYIVGLCNKGKQKSFNVHQLMAIAFLGHVPNGHIKVVDHKNGIKTDNRLSNLQVISQRENTSKGKRGSSVYTGVSFHNRSNKWLSSIYLDGKNNTLGYFENEIDAHLEYQRTLKKAS